MTGERVQKRRDLLERQRGIVLIANLFEECELLPSYAQGFLEVSHVLVRDSYDVECGCGLVSSAGPLRGAECVLSPLQGLVVVSALDFDSRQSEQARRT